MAPDISVHRAERDEKIDAYRQAYESWGDGGPREEWVERRLESPRHNRAEWWVLTADGEVVSSLGCYDLDFQYRDETVDGIGIGAVHTAPEERGEGYASTLCREVHEQYADDDYRVALLFTDIDPDFYRDLGYEPTSDRRFETDALRDLAESGPRAGLHPLDPDDQLDTLTVWYDEAHEETPLALARDREYWATVVDERPDDKFFGVSHPGGPQQGYVRVRSGDDTLRVVELVLPDGGRVTEGACYRALADFALARQYDDLRQHFAPPRQLLSFFDDNRRDQGIPMVCPLDDEMELEESWLRSNARFWEGDKF
jgi:predicted N-acetyltransferase YhbS